MSPRPLSGLRIGLLTDWASRRGGGVFEAVAAQAELIRNAGGEAPVFAMADPDADADAKRLGASPAVLAPLVGPRRLAFAPGLKRALRAAELDILHLHGIWLYPSRAGTIWVRATRRPYVVSPHGMLDPWLTARGRAKKAIARWAYLSEGLRRAATLHALTASEARDLTRESGRGEVAVIPNPAPAAGAAAARPRPPEFVYLGRIHPKKNLDALIEGWRSATAGLAADGGEAPRLRIAGWGSDEDVAGLRAQVAAAPASVRFVGPVFGDDKARLLAEARFVVLPSFSEGLPMVVLEAWAAGTPTIMTAACNLDEGFAHGAALRCGTEPEAIAGALTAGLTMSGERWLAMSRSAQALAAGPFSKAAVAARWTELYQAIANRTAPGDGR